MERKKTIALVAHDNMKPDLVEWADWDPMEAQPHDVDVKALLRLATLYNVPTAVNRSTADFMVSSPLFDGDYEPVVKDYRGYVERSLGR